MAGVSFLGVTKRYAKGTPAVSDLSLEVEDREFLVIVGPSGSGKSTVLRLLAGLEQPDEGQVRIGSRLVNGVPARERDVAMVFQSYALYPHMNVEANLCFGLGSRGVRPAEAKRRAAEVSEVLGLGQLMRRKPRELSGGERQRVALGRAMVRRPAVFLLDEPLSNLDAKLRSQMRVELQKLHRSLGTTFVYVTHDQVEAMTMGDRVAVMHQGGLQQVASPREVYERPASSFVAGFIGTPTMSFLPVTIADGKVSCPPLRLSLGVLSGVTQAVAGLRPEAFSLATPASGGGGPSEQDGAGIITAEIEAAELHGADQFVYCRCEGHALTARLDAGAKVGVGDVVSLSVDRDCVHLFDTQSGASLR
ncbi:MAG: ABC transporter ATP-binding protein [Acidimicrobiales bacterium]